MLAVLEDAVACYQRYVFEKNGKGKKPFDEVEDWVCDQGSDYLFSFVSICEVLDFDPWYLRRGLLRWKEDKLAQRQQPGVIKIPSASRTISKINYASAGITGVKQSDEGECVARLG